MAYNKEYYESHKEQMKQSRDKYRHKPENRERINEYQRNKMKELTQEQRDELNRKRREKRINQYEITRLQYRIDLKKRQLKDYTTQLEQLDHRYFMLQMVDTWDSECYSYSNELTSQMKELKLKIDNKKREIIELQAERERIKGEKYGK